MSLDQKDFDMANGKYWRDDPYYHTAVNLDRDVPEYDPEEDEDYEDLNEDEDPRNDPDEDDDWEDLEDDAQDGGSHAESEGNDDWSGYHDDLD